MNAHNISSDELVFAARLTPYRSLGAEGFRWLMFTIGSVCLTIGLVFYTLGLWPVLGFMGLDFLLLFWAFKVNYRAAKAYEDVEVSRQHVLLRKVTAKGRELKFEFPQFGTRFKVDRHEEIGITKMRLANREREVELGYFLNPKDRESFAHAFSHALSRAKR